MNNAEQIRNSINYIYRSFRKELFELELELTEHYKALEKYKSMCLSQSHEDQEYEQLLEEYRYDCDEQRSADEEKEKYEEIYNDYYADLNAELQKVDMFEDAKECAYLMDKDSHYANFINEGADLEKVISKLTRFLEEL